MSLKNYTISELQSRINVFQNNINVFQNSINEQQKQIDEIKQELEDRNNIPSKLENISWEEVIKYVEDIVNGDTDAYFEHYLFERVIEAMYGKDIWKWWNNR